MASAQLPCEEMTIHSHSSVVTGSGSVECGAEPPTVCQQLLALAAHSPSRRSPALTATVDGSSGLLFV
eukprot:4557192-Amphidinium_carterae.2